MIYANNMNDRKDRNAVRKVRVLKFSINTGWLKASFFYICSPFSASENGGNN